MIGAGAWGTALAMQAARAGNSVTLWARDPTRAATIAASRENPHLPGMRLPDPIAVVVRIARHRPTWHCWRCPRSTCAAFSAACTPGSRHWWSAPRAWSSGTLRLPLEIVAAIRPAGRRRPS